MTLRTLKKIVLLAFVLVLLSTAVVVGLIRPVVAEETIYIRADGSVEGTTHISTADNVTYSFTGNINVSLAAEEKAFFVERDNIVIDGAGYTFQGTGEGTGIALIGTSNVTIKNLKIEAFGLGIAIISSSNNTISGNNLVDNGHGIMLAEAMNNTISGNNIANRIFGIYIYNSSHHNVICGNNIANSNYGIELAEAFNNIIYENNITASNSAIVVEKSSNNTIYHNNFVNNTRQVGIIKLGYANVWDDGYPSGGNYWSDYADVDQCSGQYQNETGSDGIWDHPYEIDEYNIDHYPIVPEFPTLTSMLLVLILLTVSIAIYKRRLLKTPTH